MFAMAHSRKYLGIIENICQNVCLSEDYFSASRTEDDKQGNTFLRYDGTKTLDISITAPTVSKAHINVDLPGNLNNRKADKVITQEELLEADRAQIIGQTDALKLQPTEIKVPKTVTVFPETPQITRITSVRNHEQPQLQKFQMTDRTNDFVMVEKLFRNVSEPEDQWSNDRHLSRLATKAWEMQNKIQHHLIRPFQEPEEGNVSNVDGKSEFVDFYSARNKDLLQQMEKTEADRLKSQKGRVELGIQKQLRGWNEATNLATTESNDVRKTGNEKSLNADKEGSTQDMSDDEASILKKLTKLKEKLWKNAVIVEEKLPFNFLRFL